MPRAAGASTVTLSVLDRLIDREPEHSSEAVPTRSQSVRQLKEALRRDLEWLLNTRRVAVEPPEGLRELNRSVYLFGLPDFSSYSLSSPRDQARLLRVLQATIRLFEPRLTNLKVVQVDVPDARSHSLHFRIDGLLQIDPAPEHISFDTVLELTNGEYAVRGGADA